MGCLFSSPSTDQTGDRHRKDQQHEEPSIPNTSATQPINTLSQNLPTASPALTIGSRASTNRANNLSNAFTPRILGTSYTDKAQREKQNFNNIVQQARQAFIDISSHHRPQVSPLPPAALALTAQCEQLLSNEPVPNLRNGFFEARLPNSVFTTVDADPESTSDNSVNEIVNAILGEPNIEVVELAFACAQETCLALAEGAIPLIQNSLVITQAEFADFARE